MSESDDISAPPAAAPQPVIRKWRGPSLVWLVPIVALIVGISLLIRAACSPPARR
jgi:paraquat-inducible protein B